MAAFLRLRQRFILAALALDMHAPASPLEPRFTRAVHVALVGTDVAAGVARINHHLKMQGVVLAGGADLDSVQ